MKRFVFAFVLLLSFAVAGCDDEKNEELQNRVYQLQSKLEDIQSKLNDAESEVTDLKEKVDGLIFVVSEFDNMDWRRVVSDVKDVTDEVQESTNKVNEAVEDAINTARDD